MKMAVELDGTDCPGWATARVITDKATREMRVSYLTDSLSLLAKADLDLGGGAIKATVLFADEPGQHNLVLRKTSPGRINARLQWNKEWRGSVKDSDNPTRIVAQSNLDIGAFQRNVLEILDYLLQKHGLASYKNEWGFAFPIALHQQLKNLLRD